LVEIYDIEVENTQKIDELSAEFSPQWRHSNKGAIEREQISFAGYSMPISNFNDICLTPSLIIAWRQMKIKMEKINKKITRNYKKNVKFYFHVQFLRSASFLLRLLVDDNY
jgi:hypothetical protein